jgi:glutathione S-transferase
MLTLHTTPLSANGRKVLAVAHALGLSPAVKLVNVYRGEGQTPEHLAVNPAGQIPALTEGDFVLVESNAILVYLAEAHGDCALWSREPRARAAIARWLFWEASAWQPALTAVLTPPVAQKLGLAPPAPEALARWEDAGFQRVARLLDAHLRDREHLAGPAPTLADFSVAGMMTYARAARFPFDAYPHLAAWYERVEALDAWKATATAPWV